MEREEAYTGFADVYDTFMDETPYEAWADRVSALLRKRGIANGLVLELGCGTGTFTELLAKRGYDMIGVDSSAQMLEIAAQKKRASGADILYLLQDMRKFELYGTVRAVVSVCDTMNYLTDGQDIRAVFALVNNYLDPGGLFLFDMKTEYCFRELMGDRVFTDEREKGTFIWENAYYEEERINEYDLTLFLGQADGLYEKRRETHVQRAWRMEEIKRFLEEAGLCFEAVFDADTQKAPEADSVRVCFLARECRKKRQQKESGYR